MSENFLTGKPESELKIQKTINISSHPNIENASCHLKTLHCKYILTPQHRKRFVSFKDTPSPNYLSCSGSADNEDNFGHFDSLTEEDLVNLILDLSGDDLGAPFSVDLHKLA